jgi:ATP-dependent DNA helicase RecG
MSAAELKKYIKRQLGQMSSWDSAEADITLEDIAESKVFEYVQEANREKRIGWQYVSVEDAMDRLELIKNGRLLNTAKVMFSTHPQLELMMATFASEERLTFLDISNAVGTIKELVDVGEAYVKKTIQWRAEFGDGMTRTEVPEVPIAAIREALWNSFAHRLWGTGQNNEIAIYKNRIEIYNPGTFPDEVSPEDYIKRTVKPIQRNPLLALTMYYPKYIEHFGTGLKRIHDACMEAGVKYEFRREKLGSSAVFHRPKDLALDPVTGKKRRQDVGAVSERVGRDSFGEGFGDSFGQAVKLSDAQRQVLALIAENPTVSVKQVSEALGKTSRAVEYQISKLKKAGALRREGPDFGGYWVVAMRVNPDDE